MYYGVIQLLLLKSGTDPLFLVLPAMRCRTLSMYQDMNQTRLNTKSDCFKHCRFNRHVPHSGKAQTVVIWSKPNRPGTASEDPVLRPEYQRC
jgi:hypothetical protein